MKNGAIAEAAVDRASGMSSPLGLSRRLFLGLCGNCAEESQCGGITCRPRRAFGEKNGIRGRDRQAILFGERGNFVRLIVRLMADVKFVIHSTSSQTLPFLGSMQNLTTNTPRESSNWKLCKTIHSAVAPAFRRFRSDAGRAGQCGGRRMPRSEHRRVPEMEEVVMLPAALPCRLRQSHFHGLVRISMLGKTNSSEGWISVATSQVAPATAINRPARTCNAEDRMFAVQAIAGG